MKVARFVALNRFNVDGLAYCGLVGSVRDAARFMALHLNDEYRIGGTSLSSPLFAGLMADADQAAGGSLGFVNPLLYHLDSGGQNSQAFRDILPAGKQAVIRNDYLDGEDAAAGILTTARILGLEGATEYFCPHSNQETGECEVELEEAPESLSAASGFDSMTGIGSPGDQLIQELVKH